ncbi:MAG TPA: hypothetical protein VFB62_10050 [Polyangiaceae bacterium]|jgi:hypothetical protein|nr:hypothetical protein [Polyangiaceae bacterium]
MRLAVVLLVGLLGCGDDERTVDDDDGASSGSTGDGPHALCVDTINQYRDTLGLPPYSRWTDAESCSDGEAESDAMTGQAHGAFPQCGESAQNECPGWPGPPESMIGSCLDLMWNEGPGGGHHDNMASTSYSQAACGFYALANGDVWSVQNFR